MMKQNTNLQIFETKLAHSRKMEGIPPLHKTKGYITTTVGGINLIKGIEYGKTYNAIHNKRINKIYVPVVPG